VKPAYVSIIIQLRGRRATHKVAPVYQPARNRSDDPLISGNNVIGCTDEVLDPTQSSAENVRAGFNDKPVGVMACNANGSTLFFPTTNILGERN
jgi:hypothetical protein